MQSRCAILALFVWSPGGVIGRVEHKFNEEDINAPVSWCCVDCGVNTAPDLHKRAEIAKAFNAGAESVPQSIGFDAEVYNVRDVIWRKAGMEPFGGCLCVGCLEKRIGRKLKPKDFKDHVFNSMPGTERLLNRRKSGRKTTA